MPILFDRKRAKRSRGQSLVEFALTLPLMLLLLMIALDFGRIYLGWINLQNMTRIAANYAANNPTAWSTGDTASQTRYQNQIKADAAATNCQLPLVGGVRTAPNPTFTDGNGDGSATGIGDTVSVRLSCSFGVITPFISNIVGGSVSVGSLAVFPIKSGMSAPAVLVTPPPAPNAAFTGNAAINTTTLSAPAPFTVTFRDTSGGYPTAWHWDFQTGVVVSTGQSTSNIQDPLDVVFAVPGTYTVSLTASNGSGASTAYMTIIVTPTVTVDFTMTPSSGNAPLAVTFQDSSTGGGSNSTWTFGAGEGTGTGTTTTHTYNTAGTYTVTHSMTYSAPTGTVTRTKTITVSVGLCTVPHLDNVKRNNADSTWSTAGFSGSVSDGPSAPNGNYTIKTQSLVALSQVPCTSSVVVNDH
jgi:PKD repeat protein